MSLSGRAAIVGIVATEFSEDYGRSELKLAAEAVRAALDGAGFGPTDVDGLTSFAQDTNTGSRSPVSSASPRCRFFSRVHYGGGAACATVQQAATACATGIADVVVCYRAFNERSGQRFGQAMSGLAGAPTSSGVDASSSYPIGLSTPAAWVAMAARRSPRRLAPPRPV